MPKIICRPLRGGKTHEAIKQSAKTGATIVCFNQEEADRVWTMAEHLGLAIPVPLCINDFPQKTRGIKGSFIVDNADKILEHLMQHPIEALTLTSSTNIKEISKC